MDSPLADYLRKFYTHVRPWLLNEKETSPAGESLLFISQKGNSIKNIGETFKKIMTNYFGHPVTVGTIRKVMETALSETTTLQESEKNNLSNAMLHDPATAQEYYVAKDYMVASNAINSQWKQFRSAFVPQPIAPTAAIPVQTTAGSSNKGAPQPSRVVLLPPQLTMVPSLVSSPMHSEESIEEQDTQILAEKVANDLLQTSKARVAPAKFALQPGDWNCSFCEYTNFARRVICNRCGKGKNKRSQYEFFEDKRNSKKAKGLEDITKVLKKSTDKQGNLIYKVQSQKHGEIWVKAHHVPANLL